MTISTGIVRKLDHIGRVILPAESRLIKGIEVKDALEMFIDGKKIILKKYEPGCVLCSNAEDLFSYNGKKICKYCIKEMTK